MRGAKKRLDEEKSKEFENDEKRRKITVVAISIPATVIFFCLIFISRSASIVWGNVILFAIIAESWMISAESHDIGNKIAQIVCAPILGGIAGIIVGGIAFILSPFFTFTMVLWIIVMVIVNLIGIFAISEV